ncbi:hypothetical protein XBFFL1_2320001 [Xenorhabdus bovienii str. feltiae Florida]|uniref:Uncharacterized protein n=1 Tax=Xenorhabdus bovienii str. kraussei Becker Underwood TaxID=1398204 RepID=A0A077PX37_XENBV|nr:hypothetical protein XBFFR1_2190029 [Xenorhabdus bovienii str. feltiae France]CDG92794.1 hypothetical protein XBFFL1_2320001 [Xenorhabdus bovienii str. feltiae Florida]CDH25728.1 hypothetical protein XBKB1_4180009 [Xenorhabdus bovienii str. kraussei Becker Underwood]
MPQGVISHLGYCENRNTYLKGRFLFYSDSSSLSSPLYNPKLSLSNVHKIHCYML